MSYKSYLVFGLSVSLAASSFSTISAHAAESTAQDLANVLKSKPYSTATLSESENDKLFKKYCVGDANSAAIPQPNYSDPLVIAAAAKLSQTQTSANDALSRMAHEQFPAIIGQAKKGLQAMIDSGDPKLSGLAKDLAKELDKATPENGASQKAKDLLSQITASFGDPLIKAMGPLADKLVAQSKGIDYAVVNKEAKALSEKLQAANLTVDLKKVATLLELLSADIQKAITPLDADGVVKAIETLIPQIKAQAKSDLADYFTQSFDVLKQQLKPGGDPTYVSAVLNDLDYTITDLMQKAGLKFTGAATQAYKVFKGQTLNLALKYSLDTLTQTQNFLKTAQPDTNNADFQNLQYLLSDIQARFVTLLPELTSPLSDDIGAFGKEASKLNVESANASLKQILTATTSDTSTIISALQNFELYWQQSANVLPDSLKAADKALNEQLALAGAEYLKSMALKAQKDIAAANGQINQDLLSDAASLSSQLSSSPQNLPLSPEIKTLGAKLSVLASSSDNAAYLSSVISDQLKPLKRADHFYFYSPVVQAYRIKKTAVPDNAPKGTQPEAHTFLTLLCGEFRDRATMIEAKLNWAKNIYILPATKQTTFAIDPAKNVWSQIPASAYYPYLSISGQVWSARRDSMDRYIEIGNEKQIDNPVPGFTVCETKYIFSEYVGKGKQFDSFDAYQKGYEAYKATCPVADQRDYYDFRGDSNYKHYSPESNGMIWYATTMAAACKSTTTAKPGQTIITDQDCQNYFTHPYSYRYNAARSGLAAWLFRDNQYESQFSSQGQMVAIYPHRIPELAPFSFSFDQTKNTGDIFGYDSNWSGLPGAWNTPDIGFNAFTGLGTDKADMLTAYTRIRDAVDRHTDWYHSGYNDKNGAAKDQAYSPFVASSYVMQSSDSFTTCGITVQCPPDGLKRWMFIFRIKPENWYNPARVKNNEPVDFDRMWMDETSFGRSNLANSERAWDRLGTSTEDEMESILYLVNIQQEGMQNGGTVEPEVDPIPAAGPVGE